MNSLDKYNLLDPGVQSRPYEYYSILREEAPVYQMPQTGFYLITTYDLCNEVIRQPDLFASGVSPMALRPGGIPQGVLEIYEKEGWMPLASCSTSDPPAHTRVHHVLAQLFTTAQVRKLKPTIDSIVKDLIDEIANDGQMTFVSQFSHPLPMIIIADLLGIPNDNLTIFKKWSDAIVEPYSMMISPEREVECTRLVVEMQHYFAELVETRRGSSKDDLISQIVNIDMADFQPFNMAELLTIVSIDLLASGNETTTSAISSGMLLLCQNPHIVEEIHRQPSLMINFTEEILRLESPAQGMFRHVTHDTELNGIKLNKGDLLSLRFGSANRDEKQFPQADSIDLHRLTPGKHMAFGVGRHHCIGAVLARQEIMSAFNGLIQRFKNFALDTSKARFEYVPSFFGRSLRELWITFEKR